MPKTILVVEDQQVLREIMKEYLVDEGKSAVPILMLTSAPTKTIRCSDLSLARTIM
ncbi:hypothetical protein A8990_1529 [Paenibacillus taihuensis]|uniref:Response regulatory domain-containing protein n=1 Tax=Paenibacillus taihuensis TaxID=1156355 RepID=A0A3D9Q7H9_9BACL|nr:hypothetical protein A8990_1529 [Paenibacillus taihuensis]